MSSRQLRKLQKQKELAALEAKDQAAAESEEESEDEQPVRKSKPSAFSGFAALGGMDDEEGEDDADEDEDKNGKAESTQPANTPNAPEPVSEPERTETPKSSSKKSKKKKKKAKKAESTSSAPKQSGASKKDEIDEIDRAIQELNLSKKAAAVSSANADLATSRAYERICELLRVNTHHLKVINEMRHLFGRDAIAAAQSEEEEEQARIRRTRQASQQNVDLETYLKGQPGKALPEVTLRRNPFLPGKETWPRASTEGLTMKQIKDGAAITQPGEVEFAFAHDEGYNKLEGQFFGLVQMYDPMQLVHFLHRHPYHISSLIQVSKVAKQDQNSALSADLCERALFTFGRVSISAFRQKLEEGKARLDFRRPENRQFWLAGYHYLKSLVMKGTYRTALEWAKLLLSMDLTDPYGVIHFMHPLAIRAHESKWFIDFCDSEALDECDTAQDYIRQTLVLARLQQKDAAGAKSLLIEGMERLPWLYSGLFKALNLDIPKSIWGLQPRNQHENLFVELYIHQTKNLWDNAQAMSLLKEAGGQAKKPDYSSLATTPLAGRNVGRFVYLDNTPALMGVVPGGMLSESPNWEFDPLPPPLEDNLFSYDTQRFPWEPSSSGRGFGHGHDHIELQIPRDRRQLRRFLERIRREGAPAEVQHVIERAIEEAANEEGGGVGGGGRGRGGVHRRPGIVDDGYDLDDFDFDDWNDQHDDDLSEHDDDEFVLAGEEQEGENEEGDGPPGGAGIGRLFNAFMDLLTAGPPGAAMMPDRGYGMGMGMPGQFVNDDDDEEEGDDTDDEMPHLEPADPLNRPGDDVDDDDDDDMPELLPADR
ncbi:hypothetical protein SLS62_008972 [Diatrype stigma]|uniref:Transcription factor 25 n=1 Tax=Diatrype stigma TaxID=117547 RepID=A0AAN9UIK5_9PEZI